VGGFVDVSAGPAVDRSAALHELVEIQDLCGKQRAFRAILLNYFGLTPPDSCDNLGVRVVDFEPRKPELFHIPYCFSSLLVVNAAGATQVEVAVVDSPKALPEENND
jgi:hypothetical protein